MNFFQWLGGWALADHADHAARVAFTVQNGRWATQQLDALKEIRIHGRFRIVISLQLHPVQILVSIHGTGSGEPTNRNNIIRCRRPACCEHARRIGQRLFNRPRLLHVHLFTGDDRNRLRGFLNRGIGLGRGGGAFSRNRGCRSPGTFLCRRCCGYRNGFFFFRGFGSMCICRHAGNRCGDDDRDFTQRRIDWLSSIGKRHGVSLMEK